MPPAHQRVFDDGPYWSVVWAAPSLSTRCFLVAWYENSGAGTFERRRIERTGNGDSIGVVSVFAADVDQDGDVDILSASQDDDRIAWYENRLVGDSNNDGIFDSSDRVSVFQAGKYEDDIEGKSGVQSASSCRRAFFVLVGVSSCCPSSCIAIIE